MELRRGGAAPRGVRLRLRRTDPVAAEGRVRARNPGGADRSSARFAAVTDHAEFLAEQLLCTDPDSEAYATGVCQAIRASTAPTDSPLAFKIMHPFPSRDAEVCGDDGALACRREPELPLFDLAVPRTLSARSSIWLRSPAHAADPTRT